MGFDSFWTVEHHFLDEFSHCSAPEVLYGHVAALTRNLRIGHGVRLAPFPYNHPIRIAECAAVLDLLCEGRLEFGVGRSSTRAELEGFGIEPSETRELLEEALQMVIKAWTEEEFSWQGERFTVPKRRVVPKPYQKPHPPLWMACTSPDSHAHAGRRGLGLLSFTVGVPPEELAERIALYRQGIAEAAPVGKFVNEKVATFTMVHCAESDAEAERDARESFEWYAKAGPERIATVGQWQRERGDISGYEYTKLLDGLDTSFLTFDYLKESGACVTGDPESCTATARRFEKAGCDLLLCLVQPWKIPHEKVMKSIELLGKHVIPEFKS